MCVKFIVTVEGERVLSSSLLPSDRFTFERRGDSSLDALLESWFNHYLTKKPIPFPEKALQLTPLTPFSKKILSECLKIPFGQTRSYSDLGSPRAVGQAMAHNPFPLLIPCHRVISKKGSLTGFAFGLSMKQQLLQFEAA